MVDLEHTVSRREILDTGYTPPERERIEMSHPPSSATWRSFLHLNEVSKELLDRAGPGRDDRLVSPGTWVQEKHAPQLHWELGLEMNCSHP